MSDDPSGLYRIHAVAKMTGVPSATLRAWERRYGVPAPQRTASAYRLYSEDDVEQIRKMLALTESGMAPSDAARAIQARDEADLAPPARLVDADAYSALCDAIVDAALAFDAERLEQLGRRALIMGPAQAVFERAIAPAMAEIGQRWHDGEITIAQEHLASDIFANVSRDLVRIVQPAVPRHTVVLACVEEETHVLPLYGAALHFARWGLRTHLLGARTPPAAIGDAVGGLSPRLVGLSVTVPLPRAQADDLLGRYAKALAGVPWVVGGSGAPDLASVAVKHGALVIGTDLEAARPMIESLLSE